MFEALGFEPSPVARLGSCSRRDAGWRSVLVRRYVNAEVADEFVRPGIGEQTLVLITAGTTAIESRHGRRWQGALYGPGLIGLTAPGVPTDLRWRGTEPTMTTHVHLPGRLLERTAAELYGRDATRVPRPDSLAVHDPVLAAAITGLAEAADAGADELYAETAAAFLAAHLLTRHAGKPVPDAPHGEDRRVRRAAAFIRDNHASPLTLGEIAAVAGLSPFHFLRVFKAATGQTPHRFLTGVRLDRARRLLRRGDLSVTDIAHLCGFATPSRLATAFRRETGESPSSYRDRNKPSAPAQSGEGDAVTAALGSPSWPRTT